MLYFYFSFLLLVKFITKNKLYKCTVETCNFHLHNSRKADLESVILVRDRSGCISKENLNRISSTKSINQLVNFVWKVDPFWNFLWICRFQKGKKSKRLDSLLFSLNELVWIDFWLTVHGEFNFICLCYGWLETTFCKFSHMY